MPTDAERNAPRKRASLACSARRARAMSVTSSNVTATRRPGSGNALTEKIFRSISSSPYSISPRSTSLSSSTTRCSSSAS